MSYKSPFLFVVSVLLSLSAGPQLATGGSGGICLSAPLDLVGLSAQSCFDPQDIDYLMTLSVDLRRSSKFKMTSPQSMATNVSVESCTDYFEHQRKGWYALSQRDMDRESVFTKTCGLLSALRDAAPARRSYMKAGDGLAKLNALRPNILVNFFDGGPQAKAAREAKTARAGETLADWVAKERCSVQEASAHVLRLTFGNTNAVYRELARADFNGDGFEDILVSVGQKARGGTAGAASLFLLTRTKATGPYDTMSLPGA